uniref:Homeobox domain-containing protein n=1 Tax=Angiostrongylus cantonensis TaxID=6313 RepID=A0A158PCN0_ANGCA
MRKRAEIVISIFSDVVYNSDLAKDGREAKMISICDDFKVSFYEAHFQVDSNPDGADLERIANITGLSKRVTQVWFQNSRARQKKYQGSRKGGDGTLDSTRSSEGPGSPSQKSEASSDGMFPSSVTTRFLKVMTVACNNGVNGNGGDDDDDDDNGDDGDDNNDDDGGDEERRRRYRRR